MKLEAGRPELEERRLGRVSLELPMRTERKQGREEWNRKRELRPWRERLIQRARGGTPASWREERRRRRRLCEVRGERRWRDRSRNRK